MPATRSVQPLLDLAAFGAVGIQLEVLLERGAGLVLRPQRQEDVALDVPGGGVVRRHDDRGLDGRQARVARGEAEQDVAP